MMIVYFAGVDASPKDVLDAFKAGARHFMISYFYWRRHRPTLRMLRSLGAHIMLDSGAYSAWRRGEVINVDDYIQYIKQSQIGKYVVLDVVGDYEETRFNLRQMESQNLRPIPVFHINTPWSILEDLARDYRLICIGGTVGKSKEDRVNFFDELFERHPELFYHGLGMTMPDLMRKYPWVSVDSTTWLTGRKNARLVTDSGQIPMDKSIPVSERTSANVRYFSRLERSISRERLDVTC